MTHLHLTRNELIEIVVLSAVVVATWVGLRSGLLTQVQLTFIAGNYTMYLVWCVAATWRGRIERLQDGRVTRP